MVAGIVILHVPPYAPLGTETTAFDYLKAFFSQGVFRATVPVLTVISGYLLFAAQLDRAPLALYRKKAYALLVPFLLCNTPIVVAIYAIQALGLSSHSFSLDLQTGSLTTWANALFGLFDSPANYPLNFLRDLIVLVCLAPLFGMALRHAPWLGLGFVCLVAFLDLDQDLVLRNTMMINFYIGGLAALRGWDLNRLDRWGWLSLAIFLALSMVTIGLAIHNRTFLHLVSPPLIWSASAVLIKSAPARWLGGRAHYSFFVYLSHGPVLLITWMIYSRWGSDFVPYPMFWVAAPVLSIAFCMCIYHFLATVCPGFLSPFVGGRVSRRRVDRTDRNALEKVVAK